MTNPNKKIQRFHALLDKCNLKDQKANILYGQGVESTLGLSEKQLDGLNWWLESQLKWVDLKDYQFATFDFSNQQHKYILSLCQEYGWTVYDDKRGRNIADLNKLGKWIRYSSQSKKPLQQQDTKELQTTVYAFEQMAKKHFS
ncbi:MAG: hypothetical protein QM500_15515 [Methylococcales bacterium]